MEDSPQLNKNSGGDLLIFNGVHYNKMDFFDITDDGRIICKLCGNQVRTYRGRRTHLVVKHADYFGVKKEKVDWINIAEFTRKQKDFHARAMAEWYNSSGWNRTEVRR